MSQHAWPQLEGKTWHVPPPNKWGQTEIVGAAANIFRALHVRNFSPSQFFIACSTAGSIPTDKAMEIGGQQWLNCLFIGSGSLDFRQALES